MRRELRTTVEILGLLSLGFGLYSAYTSIEAARKAREDRARLKADIALIKKALGIA